MASTSVSSGHPRPQMLNVARRFALVTAFSTALARASPFSIDGNATEPKSSSDAAVRRVSP